jgi:hypothetical protein
MAKVRVVADVIKVPNQEVDNPRWPYLIKWDIQKWTQRSETPCLLCWCFYEASCYKFHSSEQLILSTTWRSLETDPSLVGHSGENTAQSIPDFSLVGAWLTMARILPYQSCNIKNGCCSKPQCGHLWLVIKKEHTAEVLCAAISYLLGESWKPPRQRNLRILSKKLLLEIWS